MSLWDEKIAGHPHQASDRIAEAVQKINLGVAAIDGTLRLQYLIHIQQLSIQGQRKLRRH